MFYTSRNTTLYIINYTYIAWKSGPIVQIAPPFPFPSPRGGLGHIITVNDVIVNAHCEAFFKSALYYIILHYVILYIKSYIILYILHPNLDRDYPYNIYLPSRVTS